jgi:heterogeneous nuclear ribonucleoprotein F/H
MPRRGGDGSSADVLEELLGPFPVVRLRGLPFEAQVSDIISFFQVRRHATGR